jgi:prevent-host-death family protein
MISVSASDARATLPELLTRVQDGDEVTITRHGQPVAVLVHPDAARRPRAGDLTDRATQIHDLLAEASMSGAVGLSAERAEELIRDIRAGRRGH